MPPRAKAQLLWLFTARLKPAPFYKAFFRGLFRCGWEVTDGRKKLYPCVIGQGFLEARGNQGWVAKAGRRRIRRPSADAPVDRLLQPANPCVCV